MRKRAKHSRFSPSLEQKWGKRRGAKRVAPLPETFNLRAWTMDGFNELLLKLREVHERELEGWQMKVQELSNKKGCDTKRMEELFTKNQQMKEQQRLLTENIKTLENRLRAGLCDRCTVTQEVAKRRQQEFEVSQMQTIQHITLLAGETNCLKKENRRLRDEIENLKEALNNTPLEAKPNISPDLSPSSGPVSLIGMATGRGTSDQPIDGNVGLKIDTNQRADGKLFVFDLTESEFRQLQEMTKPSHFIVSTLTSPSWKTDNGATQGERRSHIAGTLDQPSPIPAQALLMKTSSPSLNADMNPTRRALKAPVPCRPQPIKSSPVPFPWGLPESSAWASMAASGTNLVRHPYLKLNLPRFPNLVATSQHTGLSSNQDHVYGSQWHKHSSFQGPIKEPTVVFRVKNLSEHTEILGKSQEKKGIQTSSTEKVSRDGLKDLCDGPLDLSDRGKSKSSQTPNHELSLFSQEEEGVDTKLDKELMQSLPKHGEVVSPSASPSLPPPLPAVTQQEEVMQQKHKQVVKEYMEQNKEANGMTEQSNGKKVPALTISLRPVVVVETLQKQDPLATKGKSSPPAVEPANSEEQVEEGEEEEDEDDEEEEKVSEQETNHSYKRKKLFMDKEMDQDSETDAMGKAKKVKITLRALEKSSS
ncbi:RBBP8 N-terminal-like protein [Syngnathoides biaculeatus]|uniref:RBBP8 N-terminal-like protein n=1 Tax=Syngnathoides biaculeatus TaxID=300417 RepID=UPI002ADD950B|nr:RBBP8 N-terminal-like protein [Syngnathoides biaculeatus]